MCVLGAMLLPIRLIIVFSFLSISIMLSAVGVAGLKKEDIDKKPFTGWRLALRSGVSYLLRFMFFCCGFRVKIIGRQASAKEAAILTVAPHSTFFDVFASLKL